MSLESIEKMRKLAKHWRKISITPGKDPFADEVDEHCDAIEAEVAERFMELPVDADGVPIRVGDTVYGKYVRGNPEYTVAGFDFDREHGQWNVKVGAASWASQGLLSHKPRTVEDVLAELEGLRGYGNSTYEGVVTRAAELADEIRGLLDAER